MSDPLSRLIPTSTPLLFDDGGDVKADAKARDKIHVRVQQRNGRKTLTTVTGLVATSDGKPLDANKVLKVFKKEFACNGCVVDDPEAGRVIQLQGDHRAKVVQILVEDAICAKEDIQVHGF